MICGSSAWICARASTPSRAVPMTRNSRESSTMRVMIRRMNALSSTTRTVVIPLEDTIPGLEGPHLDVPVGEVEVHAASVVETGVLGHEGDVVGREHLARREDVALAHV